VNRRGKPPARKCQGKPGAGVFSRLEKVIRDSRRSVDRGGKRRERDHAPPLSGKKGGRRSFTGPSSTKGFPRGKQLVKRDGRELSEDRN